MRNIRNAAWLWMLSYCLMTIATIAFTIAIAVLFNIPSARELEVSVGTSPIYSAAMPYHWLIGIVFWSYFAYKYLSRFDYDSIQSLRREAMQLAGGWALLTIASDFVVWIALPTPMQMTAREMYIVHGVWSFAVYLSVAAGSFLALLLVTHQSFSSVSQREADS